MKAIRIVIVAVLIAANAWATNVLWAELPVNAPANENREERSNMTDEKVIMLVEANIQPERRAEVAEAARDASRSRSISFLPC